MLKKIYLLSPYFLLLLFGYLLTPSFRGASFFGLGGDEVYYLGPILNISSFSYSELVKALFNSHQTYGHPPFFYYLYGFFVRLFGSEFIFLFHILLHLLSSCIYFYYLDQLLSKKIAFFLSLLLVVQNIFITNIALLYPDLLFAYFAFFFIAHYFLSHRISLLMGVILIFFRQHSLYLLFLFSLSLLFLFKEKSTKEILKGGVLFFLALLWFIKEKLIGGSFLNGMTSLRSFVFFQGDRYSIVDVFNWILLNIHQNLFHIGIGVGLGVLGLFIVSFFLYGSEGRLLRWVYFCLMLVVSNFFAMSVITNNLPRYLSLSLPFIVFVFGVFLLKLGKKIQIKRMPYILLVVFIIGWGLLSRNRVEQELRDSYHAENNIKANIQMIKVLNRIGLTEDLLVDFDLNGFLLLEGREWMPGLNENIEFNNVRFLWQMDYGNYQHSDFGIVISFSEEELEKKLERLMYYKNKLNKDYPDDDLLSVDIKKQYQFFQKKFTLFDVIKTPRDK